MKNQVSPSDSEEDDEVVEEIDDDVINQIRHNIHQKNNKRKRNQEEEEEEEENDESVSLGEEEEEGEDDDGGVGNDVHQMIPEESHNTSPSGESVDYETDSDHQSNDSTEYKYPGNTTLFNQDNPFYMDMKNCIENNQTHILFRNIFFREPVFLDKPGPSRKNPSIGSIVGQWMANLAKRKKINNDQPKSPYDNMISRIKETTKNNKSFAKGDYDDLPKELKNMIVFGVIDDQ